MKKLSFKFKLFLACALVLIVASITVIILFVNYINSFEAAYNNGNLYQQIKFAFSENLFSKSETLSEYDHVGIEAYRKQVTYSESDYVITYVNPNDIENFFKLYGRIETKFNGAEVDIYIYKDYYDIGFIDDSKGLGPRFSIGLNFDEDTVPFEDEPYYNEAIKVISLDDMEQIIQVFNNEAKNDMDIIYEENFKV